MFAEKRKEEREERRKRGRKEERYRKNEKKLGSVESQTEYLLPE